MSHVSPAPAPHVAAPGTSPAAGSGRLRFPWWRLPFVAALLALAVVLALYEAKVRYVEAQIAAWVAGRTITGQTAVLMSGGSPAFAFNVDHHWFGIRLTVECSIALYLAALAVLSAVFLLLPKTVAARVFLAAAISAVGLVVLNQVRLLMLAFALGRISQDAFAWAHSFAGSVLMLIGVVLCLLLFLRLSFGTRTAAKRTSAKRTSAKRTGARH
jgi:exosortase/archaeosortase family protein